MQWTPGGSDSDIEDRRSDSGGGGFGFGGGGGFGRVPLGIGGILVLGVLSILFNQNFFSLFTGGGSGTAVRSTPSPELDRAEQNTVEFVKFVLNDVQSTWDTTLPRETGTPYRHAKLVLYRGALPSACGTAQSAVGPFYCPADEKVYLDLSFFQELSQRFQAPGEFAEAYVIAHEIGHHVQKIRGIEPKVRRLQQSNPEAQNQLSVAMELQADCYAGVWAHSTEQRRIIDNSDIEAGLNAAAAIGDDRLQRMSRGRVSPESFTHGSSEQRVHWFRQGIENGSVAACNTFQDL